MIACRARRPAHPRDAVGGGPRGGGRRSGAEGAGAYTRRRWSPGPSCSPRYTYPPNALGYCGPEDPGGLLGAAGRGELVELAQRAAAFTGAWPYLRAIAGANGIADPLDRRVVDAYWVGNGLLDAVGAGALAAAAASAGAGAASPTDPAWAAAGENGAMAHHSFHVFAVYPWLGLLHGGREEPALTVLDRCRIRWGTVDAVDGDAVRVRSASLCFHRGRLALGPERSDEVRRSVDGVGLVDALAPGDRVSMHWDWVCERIDAARAASLESYTLHNLAVVNDS